MKERFHSLLTYFTSTTSVAPKEMMKELKEYVLLIGFVSIFKIANTSLLVPDPLVFNSSGVNLKEDVTFFLYTQSNPKPQQLYIGDIQGLSKCEYNIDKPTKFYTHGWKRNGSDSDVCSGPVKKGFLTHDFNLIVVDWTRIANFPHYIDAAVKTLAMAKYFAKMIDFLVDQGSDPRDMSIVGHSLGCHIAGLAAFHAKTNIPHVIALDPVGPGFIKHDNDGRLHVDDADLVEVIHTNDAKFGYPLPLQGIDYYVNGGGFQLGCYCEKDPNLCSHIRACLYYAESISKPRTWFARRCNNENLFVNGYCDKEVVVPFAKWTHRVRRPPGKYYVRSNEQPYFGLGVEGLKTPQTV